MDTSALSTSLGARARSRSITRAGSRAKAANKNVYFTGIVILFTVVFLWTASNFVTQDLLVGGWEKPFLITYLNTSSFALYLLPFSLRWLWRRRQGESEPFRRSGYEPLATDAAQALSDSIPSLRSLDKLSVQDVLLPLTTRQTADLAFIFCFFWFIANWSVNAALDYTTVASTTILSTTSGIFTLAIGRLFRVESLSLAKVIAVVMSFSGVVLVSLSDGADDVGLGENASRPLLGDFLALLSAFFYALYVTLLKVRIRDESRIDMQLFFGFVGLFNVVTLWPIIIILHFTGAERFEFPSGGRMIGGILINMFITLSSDYLYLLAMLKTTPLVVTVGLSLTIPLAVIGDFFLNKPSPLQVLIGAAMVVLSFFIVGITEKDQQEQEKINRAVVGDVLNSEEGPDVPLQEEHEELEDRPTR
ncbi:hypothetical protein PUNSTDRAFT_80325 [Punctularia strigosozonata HHB-11173 SS5]|uniref:uncharacterized protein n=1 Tax=Punctularia strigosozonata (strain HHB-11173) TaxID=741275 RepID=UPI000441659F|nr:uncharacterized protein PUNSTDRAFT_80325 [Punctularia strigosozonata HHB-11173 SS5]EIN14181.1 hypothetical protein PUNSTDRAFT_80325 [Punctularia strigosozonata HHB-11173 SS5]